MTKTVHYEYDPTKQLEPNVKVGGNVLHGIDPEKPTIHGTFLQKNERVKVTHPGHKELGKSKDTPKTEKPKPAEKSEGEKEVDMNLSIASGESLEAAKKVEAKAKKLVEDINLPQPAPGQMLIKVAMTNKKETPDLRLTTEQDLINKKEAKKKL